MAIARPITKTLISTTAWGVPVTDELNRLTDRVAWLDAHWANIAKGQVAYTLQSADMTVTDTAVNYLFTATGVPTEVGRAYRIDFSVTCYSTAADNVVACRVYEGGVGGTSVADVRFIVPCIGNSNLYQTVEYSRNWIPANPGTPVNMSVGVQKSGSSTGNFTFLARSGAASAAPFIRITDVGPINPVP
jgi:hypothetical protein